MKKRTRKGKNDKRELEIYQANQLVQARKHYGIIEHRLFRLAIADLRPKLRNSKYYDENFRPFHMSTKELLDYFQGEGGEQHSLYKKFFEAYKNMAQSVVVIGTAENNRIIPVFEEISFNVKDGLFIQFNTKMRKLLLDLDEGEYTKSFLRYSFVLSSTYSLILLELMLQYQGLQKDGIIERDLSVKELRFSMDVPDDAYDGRIDNFRRKVLNAAIREINKKTDYHMEPEYGLLRGQYNRVTGFHFVLHLPETETKEQKQPELSDGLKERLVKYGIKRDIASRLSLMPYAEECLQIALRHIRKDKVRNPAAYIRTAIEKNWYEQREAVWKAWKEEKKEHEDKMKWNMEASGRNHAGSMDEDGTSPEEQRKSLEEFAKENTPIGKFAKKLLDRMKEQPS